MNPAHKVNRVLPLYRHEWAREDEYPHHRLRADAILGFARLPHSISLAVGDGAWAGAQVHQSLVFAAAA